MHGITVGLLCWLLEGFALLVVRKRSGGRTKNPTCVTSELQEIGRGCTNCPNTRYEVTCSIAIPLEITANLYAGRRNCEYE
jgi:hypothetical protein